MSTDARPLVSIVIPCLDAAPFLAEAIESVVAQDYTRWELHIVDDGSTDGSRSIAERYAQRFSDRVRCRTHPDRAHRGTAATRNLGVHRSSGTLLAFLDADDVWMPGKLRRQVELLVRAPSVGATYGRTLYWGSWNGAPDAVDTEMAPGGEPGLVYGPGQLTVANYPLGGGRAPSMNAVCMRRSVFERIGGFEEGYVGHLRMYEDQAFLTKLYLETPILVSDLLCDRYRQHDRSMCATIDGAGHYNEVRRFFLEWCGRYFAAKAVESPEIHGALARAWSHVPG